MGISPVQTMTPVAATSGSLPAVTQQGSTVIVWYGAQGATAPTGVTVGSASCVLLKSEATTAEITIWMATNVPAGQQVITVTGGTTLDPVLYAAEFSGGGAMVADKTAAAAASSGAFSSGTTATTATAVQLWVGGSYIKATSAATPSITGAWTSATATSGTNKAAFGYQVVSSTGAATFSGSVTGSGLSNVAAVVTIETGPVTITLPTAGVVVAALSPTPASGARALTLPTAGVIVAALSPTPASGARALTLPTAGVVVAAHSPAPVYARTVQLGVAGVTVAAHMVTIPRALILAIASEAGVDDYGNPFPRGMTTFEAVTGQYVNLDQGAVALQSDTGQFGPSGIVTVPSLPGAMGISSGQATAADNPVNITMLSEAASGGVPDGQIQLIAGETEVTGTLIVSSLTVNGQVISVPQGAPPTVPAAPTSYNQATWGTPMVNTVNYLIAVLQAAGIIP